MGDRHQTVLTILTTTTEFLTSDGLENFSMRRIAKLSGISLSNLQYYFKNKPALLKAVIEYFFKTCEQQILNEIPQGEANKEDSNYLLREILNNFLLSDEHHKRMTLFREIWAISARDNEIKATAHQYYKNYCQRLIEIATPYYDEPEKVVSLIIPFVEGYSIMGKALPINKQQVIDMLMASFTKSKN